MPLTDSDRNLLFWFGCIPARVGLWHYLETQRNPQVAIASRLAAAATGVFWSVKPANPHEKGFTGGNIWWSEARKLHGLAFLFYAITGNTDALAADVGIAIASKLKIIF